MCLTLELVTFRGHLPTRGGWEQSCRPGPARSRLVLQFMRKILDLTPRLVGFQLLLQAGKTLHQVHHDHGRAAVAKRVPLLLLLPVRGQFFELRQLTKLGE